jgi:hypothetical protein
MRRQSLKTMLRAAAADARRREREERTRLRELERRAKELAKLSALEQARLEVETRDAEFVALLTVHKEEPERVDWYAVAATLLPPEPQKARTKELRANQDEILAQAGLERFKHPGSALAAASALAAD